MVIIELLKDLQNLITTLSSPDKQVLDEKPASKTDSDSVRLLPHGQHHLVQTVHSDLHIHGDSSTIQRDGNHQQNHSDTFTKCDRNSLVYSPNHKL